MTSPIANNHATSPNGRADGNGVSFFLCRHGQTEYNRARRLQGHIDTPLTPDGVADALLVAGHLRGRSFDRVYSSDLGRAFRTAYLICGELGLTNRIEATSALRERSFGEYHGQPSAEIRQHHPSVFGDSHYAPAGGESHAFVQERVLTFLRQAAVENPGGRVLVVTHDGVLNAVRAAFLETDVAAFHERHHNRHDLVLRVEVEDGRLVAVGHLPQPNGVAHPSPVSPA